jgi:Putative beta-lactamase-inhibitor-like, PepSY-like
VRNLLAASVVAVALAVLSFTAAAWADEEKIPLDKVPKVVLDAVKAKYPGAELVGAAKETVKDKVEYEVIFKYKGHNYDVILTPEGKITVIEKEIPVKDLPKAVTKALDEKYPKATYKKAEELTKGNDVSYEVVLVTAQGSQVEVVLDPTGKILVEEVQKTKKDK